MIDFVFKKAMTPPVRRLFITLVIVAFVLVVLHILAGTVGIHPFWPRLLHLSHEYAVSSTYSSAILLAVTLTALVNGLSAASSGHWQRAYFLFLAGVYLFLTLDEYFIIHEGIGPWVIVYPIAGAVFVAVNLAADWFAFRDEKGLFALVLGGFGLMGASAVGFEVFGHHILCNLELTKYYCHYTEIPEEFFEMTGISLALTGLLSYGQTKLADAGWRLAKRFIAGGSVIWAAALIVYLWVFPALEARFLAQPVEAQYLDGTLSLIGYRVSRNVLAPGDSLTVTLYWQSHDRLTENFNVSAHLVTHPEVRSVTQKDKPIGDFLGWQTLSWVPGPVMRDSVKIDLPEDVPTPASYWITVRVWHQYVEAPVEETDRQLIEADTLVLGSLPVLSDTSLPAPQIEASYQFGDGFALTGYSLPERGVLGDTLPVTFWWESNTNVEVEATQFIHLIESDGESVALFDQQPFGGAFPTSDWPARMQVTDTVSIPLPADIPPGEYHVHTGMYILETGVRRSVTDADGQPVQDNSVYLGTVTLTP
jgi:hypothetical protein